MRVSNATSFLLVDLIPAGVVVQQDVSGIYTSPATSGVALSTSTACALIVAATSGTPVVNTTITAYRNGAQVCTYTVGNTEELAFTQLNAALPAHADVTSYVTSFSVAVP